MYAVPSTIPTRIQRTKVPCGIPFNSKLKNKTTALSTATHTNQISKKKKIEVEETQTPEKLSRSYFFFLLRWIDSRWYSWDETRQCRKARLNATQHYKRSLRDGSRQTGWFADLFGVWWRGVEARRTVGQVQVDFFLLKHLFRLEINGSCYCVDSTV